MTGLLLAACIGQPILRGDVASYANLAVYPINSSNMGGSARDYISLDEGLKQGTVVVTETGGQVPGLVRNRPPAQGNSRQTTNSPIQQRVQSNGTVNTLWLINKSGKKLFIMTGEIVAGGKQDRIIQKDVLIPPSKEPVNLSVFCVEQQRWAAASGKMSFSPGGAGGGGGLADPTLRGKSQNERNQQAVWSQVESTSKRLKTENATKTYQANLNDPKLAQSVEGYVKAIEKAFPLNSANGAVVAINGKLVWMDRFMDDAMFRKYWPKLIRSYALDAIQSRERTPTPKLPTYDAAMRFANARDGKMTHEAEDGVWQLTKIESSAHVIFELTDLMPAKDLLIHASKMAK